MDQRTREALGVLAPTIASAAWEEHPGGIIVYLHPGVAGPLGAWLRAARASSAYELFLFVVRQPAPGLAICVIGDGAPICTVVLTNLDHVAHLVTHPLLVVALPAHDPGSYHSVEIDLGAPVIRRGILDALALLRPTPRCPLPVVPPPTGSHAADN